MAYQRFKIFIFFYFGHIYYIYNHECTCIFISSDSVLHMMICSNRCTLLVFFFRNMVFRTESTIGRIQESVRKLQKEKEQGRGSKRPSCLPVLRLIKCHQGSHLMAKASRTWDPCWMYLHVTLRLCENYGITVWFRILGVFAFPQVRAVLHSCP